MTQVDRLLKSVRWRAPTAEPSLALFAIHRFDVQLQRLLRKGRCDPDDFVALHRFRVECKQTRYIAELLATGMPRIFRESMSPILETLQEKLGIVNDHVTAATRLKHWHQAMSAEHLRKNERIPWLLLVEQHRREAQRLAESLRLWWTDEQKQTIREVWVSCQQAS